MSDIKTILKTIDDAVNKLSDHVSAQQEPVFKKLLGMVKNLETRGDNLLSNIKNLKLINNIKVELERLIIDDKYKSQLKSFAEAYHEIQNLHNEYFAQFNAAYKPRSGLQVIKKTALESTLNGLTETGIQAGVTEGLRRILLNNTSTGGSYSGMVDQLRNYMLNTKESDGALLKYVKTYSTTAINQYSAEYNKAIADDLGLEWYMYDGSLLTTSRAFCIECVAKKYIHVSEFGQLLQGHVNGKQLHLNKSTGLPDGLMAGTDKTNLIRRRGGWNCGHQMIAVDEVAVPKNVKDAVYATADYKASATANGKTLPQKIEEKAPPVDVKQPRDVKPKTSAGS
jgi:hypothetical protein